MHQSLGGINFSMEKQKYLHMHLQTSCWFWNNMRVSSWWNYLVNGPFKRFDLYFKAVIYHFVVKTFLTTLKSHHLITLVTFLLLKMTNQARRQKKRGTAVTALSYQSCLQVLTKTEQEICRSRALPAIWSLVRDGREKSRKKEIHSWK